MTTTAAVPGSSAGGTVTTMLVSDQDTTVAGFPPIVTVPVAVPKFVPVIVRRVPPATGPWEGVSVVTCGMTAGAV